MNIKQAKEEIKNSVLVYFSKDEFGEYEIPIERQRPIFLMGPPGIGKTAIMEQIAAELGVGLVSYSMTHHTRQSAIGLPFIEKKNYGGKEYAVSEYTMSEIIASIYDMMEETGVKEGIIFLDEINCVSETLAPTMLQFLQYKIFGRHKVPDGWMIVTAGNPPEYNNSVREFDIVTWDRLKRIDIEASFDAWKEYAYRKGTHAAVMTYLEIKKDDFYTVETTIDGKSFVTARGWSDLSDMMRLYEKNGIEITENLISQYLQNERISREFAIYYSLYRKYASDYQIDDILTGNASDGIKARAVAAPFDERLTLIGLLLDSVTEKLKSICLDEMTLRSLMGEVKDIRIKLAAKDADAISILEDKLSDMRGKLSLGRKASSLSDDDIYMLHMGIRIFEEEKMMLIEERDEKPFGIIKNDFDIRNKRIRSAAKTAKEALSNVFRFCDEVFGDGQEMLILVTELTISHYGAAFISKYGCDEYYAHNKELLFYERQKEIIAELDELDEL